MTYPYSFAYVGQRPVADVVLRPSHPAASTWVSLVDTGADYLQLPAAAAANVGISLATAPTKTVKTAAGTVSLPFLTGLDVDIEGYTVQVDVLFEPSSSVSPLLGRQALFAAYEVGFNTVEWLAK